MIVTPAQIYSRAVSNLQLAPWQHLLFSKNLHRYCFLQWIISGGDVFINITSLMQPYINQLNFQTSREISLYTREDCIEISNRENSAISIQSLQTA